MQSYVEVVTGYEELKTRAEIVVGHYRSESGVQDGWFLCPSDHGPGANKMEHESKHRLSPAIWTKANDNPELTQDSRQQWYCGKSHSTIVKTKEGAR